MSREIKRVGVLTYERCKTYTYPSHYEKKIGPNTWIKRVDAALAPSRLTFGVFFHGNEIIRFYDDGAVLLYSRGYQSATTKQRLSALSPVHVCQVKGEWYVGHQKFYEGMNVGKPRNEREALEKGMREGDELAARMLQDMEQGI